MIIKNDISIGILSGGKNNRFGYNKAFLTLNKKSFLFIIINICKNFYKIYISINNKKKYKRKIHDYILIKDKIYNYGPLEGIYRILKKIDTFYIFIIAVDMPMINKRFLYNIISKINGDEDCLIIKKNKKNQPLCSIYTKNIIHIIKLMYKKNKHKLNYLFKNINIKYINFETLNYNNMILSNINTWDKYKKLYYIYKKY